MWPHPRPDIPVTCWPRHHGTVTNPAKVNPATTQRPAAVAHQPRCLVCGPDNPTGFGAHFRVDGGDVVGEVVLSNGQEGAPGFAHGGAVAAVLDDIASTVLMVAEIPAVTVNLEVSYRAPVLLDAPLIASAREVEVDGRKHRIRAELRDSDHQLLAEATVLLLAVDAAYFSRSGTGETWIHRRHDEE